MRAKISRAQPGGVSHASWFAPALTLAIAAPACVQAQTTESMTSIEQVIVTARKRDESLLDVPISISAVTEDMMSRNAMRSVADIAPTVPGLVARLPPGRHHGQRVCQQSVR